MLSCFNFHSQDIRSQWQNYALFLAALSRSCLHENQDLSALKKAIPPRLLPDKIRVLHSAGLLLGDFVAELINYVDVGDVQTRDTVRDALGIELSPRLYGKMIRNLEEYVLDSSHHDYFSSVALVPLWPSMIETRLAYRNLPSCSTR